MRARQVVSGKDRCIVAVLGLVWALMELDE